jgi:osmotically-inducible protein OsmY
MNESDKALEIAIKKKLLSNGEVDTHNFAIEVDEGVVKLEGDVSGRHAKRVIDECLSKMEGIRHVENRLKIRRVSRFSDNSMHGF